MATAWYHDMNTIFMWQYKYARKYTSLLPTKTEQLPINHTALYKIFTSWYVYLWIYNSDINIHTKHSLLQVTNSEIIAMLLLLWKMWLTPVQTQIMEFLNSLDPKYLLKSHFQLK